MLVCSDSDVAAVLDLADLLPVVADAFERDGSGAVERPDRPHFPIGTGITGDEPLGTGLTMPAYLHGDDTYATKLVSVHLDNPPERPTIHAQILLTDAATGDPAALLAGERITNARTGCIGGLAAARLADAPVTLGVVGAGAQARWQTRAIAAATDLADVRIYSPSDSREACAADLRDEGIDARAVGSARTAVERADVLVTATTATAPTFPADALADGTLVVAVGAYTAETQELPPAVVERAARLYADVPEEAVETGDLLAADHGEPTPFSAVVAGGEERVGDDEVVLVKSVGTAVLDAAAGGYVYDAAREAGLGESVTL
ncbi:ornithine cyclodeaminase family protein [Halosegnis marinus]|uniref:Ornithine cyclodeaminase family protein n=1 Tax=Halosegnis marinus TaxID=3034023 RepID=A0ABD5ZS89_9EURY|nr:ornithine cyclodeaminase family protein [Halosegnis sp. DT85]